MRRRTSIIWEPPIIVFRREAWPGQSTNVNWSFEVGMGEEGCGSCRPEKPRSRVIPLDLDSVDLSIEAVETREAREAESVVFPEST